MPSLGDLKEPLVLLAEKGETKIKHTQIWIFRRINGTMQMGGSQSAKFYFYPVLLCRRSSDPKRTVTV